MPAQESLLERIKRLKAEGGKDFPYEEGLGQMGREYSASQEQQGQGPQEPQVGQATGAGPIPEYMTQGAYLDKHDIDIPRGLGGISPEFRLADHSEAPLARAMVDGLSYMKMPNSPARRDEAFALRRKINAMVTGDMNWSDDFKDSMQGPQPAATPQEPQSNVQSELRAQGQPRPAGTDRPPPEPVSEESEGMSLRSVGGALLDKAMAPVQYIGQQADTLGTNIGDLASSQLYGDTSLTADGLVPDENRPFNPNSIPGGTLALTGNALKYLGDATEGAKTIGKAATEVVTGEGFEETKSRFQSSDTPGEETQAPTSQGPTPSTGDTLATGEQANELRNAPPMGYEATYQTPEGFVGVKADGTKEQITEEQMNAHTEMMQEQFRQGDGIQTQRMDGGSATFEQGTGNLRDPKGPTDAQYLESQGIERGTDKFNEIMSGNQGQQSQQQGQQAQQPTPQENIQKAIGESQNGRLDARQMREAREYVASRPDLDVDPELGYVQKGQTVKDFEDILMGQGDVDRKAAKAMAKQQAVEAQQATSQGDVDPYKQQMMAESQGRMGIAQKNAELAQTKEQRQAFMDMAKLEEMDRDAQLSTLKEVRSFMDSQEFFNLGENAQTSVRQQYLDGLGVSAQAANPTGGKANEQIQAIKDKMASGELSPEQMKQAEEILLEMAAGETVE